MSFALANGYMPASVALLIFREDNLRTVAKALQNAAIHSELQSLFRDCHLSEPEAAEGMPNGAASELERRGVHAYRAVILCRAELLQEKLFPCCAV